MHSVNTRRTGSIPTASLALLIGQPHVQEALAAQGVEQEAVLGHGQQDRHRIRQLGLHPQAEHHVLHLRAIERVHRRVAGAELPGEMLQRARAAALADRQHVLSGEVACGRVETFRNELDMVRPLVRDGEQLIFDVGDPDIARPEILDRIRALGPHLGVGARHEQALLDLRRKLQVLAALDGDDLLAAHITLLRGLPHDPAAIPQPASVVDLDRHPRPHQMVQEQGKAQPTGPPPVTVTRKMAAGDGRAGGGVARRLAPRSGKPRRRSRSRRRAGAGERSRACR